MSLEIKIAEDLKDAMKAKDKVRMESLRAAKTAFILAKTEKGDRSALAENEELKILQKLVKQRKDSATIYKEQGRNDLYEKEIGEAKVLEEYLPQKLTEEELTLILKNIISKVGASSPQDMGKVMGAATKELAGRADGKEIAAKVKELLTS